MARKTKEKPATVMVIAELYQRASAALNGIFTVTEMRAFKQSIRADDATRTAFLDCILDNAHTFKSADGSKEKYIVIDVNNGTVEFFDDRHRAKEYMEDQINDDDVDEGDVRLFKGRELKFDTERKSTVLIVDE